MSTDKCSLSLPLMVGCQLVRLAVAVWFIWDLVSSAIFWSNKEEILRTFGTGAGHALKPISGFQQAAGYSVSLVANFTAAILVVKVWRLLGDYIAGHIFDQQAISAFRAMAGVAMVAYVVSIATDQVAVTIVSNGGLTFWFELGDLLDGTMVLILVILAEVFSAGAAIADEHSRIV